MAAFGSASIEDVADEQPSVSDSLMSRENGIWDSFVKINRIAISKGDTGFDTADSRMMYDSIKASICVASGFMFNTRNGINNILVKCGKMRTKGKTGNKYDSSMGDDQKRSTVSLRFSAARMNEQSFSVIGLPVTFVVRGYRKASTGVHAYVSLSKDTLTSVIRMASQALKDSKRSSTVVISDGSGITESDINGYYNAYLNPPEVEDVNSTIPAIVYDAKGGMRSMTYEGLCDKAQRMNRTIKYTGIAAVSVTLVSVYNHDCEPGTPEFPYGVRLRIVRAGLLKLISK
jgi:hypothetical protein